MKIQTSCQISLLLGTFAVAGVVQASCLADESEIGDIGPDSSRICKTLKQDFPNATIEVQNRNIRSPTKVIVTGRIDGKPFSLEYRLEYADWVRSSGPCLAGL